jgi:hypothetical protein
VRPGANAATLLGTVAVLLAACGGQEPPAKPPPPAAPPKDPPILAQIASACARVSACTHAHDAARFRDPGACVDWWLSESEAKEGADPLRKCLSEATTCEKVSTCMHGGGDARAAAFCEQRAGVVSGCDGDRLVSCGEDDAHEGSVVDCARIGATCREATTGGLVVRACWSPQKCPAGAPATRCDGPGAVLSCRAGAFKRVVCPPGTTCEERKDKEEDTVVAVCALPKRRRCDVGGARHCEDDRLVECERTLEHSSEARVTDCVGFGLRCAGVGPRAGCSVPANVECDKALLPRCEGGSVVFCAAGRLTKVSCSSIGLGTCDPSARGPMAACVLAPTSTAAAPTK